MRSFPGHAGLVCALALGATLLAAPASAQAPVQARSAYSFVDSLGVNIHMAHNARAGGEFATNAYNDVAKTEQALTYLGIKYARDFFAANNPDILRKLHSETRIKYGIFLGVGWGLDYEAQMSLIHRNADMLASVEGPNEVDNWPPTFDGLKGYPASIAQMRRIHADIKGTPASEHLPVYCLTLGDADANRFKLGDLSAYCDYAVAHPYPVSGKLAYPFIQHWNNLSLSWAPNLPIVITEGGYSTRPSMTASADEASHAKLELNFLFDVFAQGVSRTYLYELLDEYEPGYQNNERSWHYGLFRYNGTPKPAATAIRAVVKLLRDKEFAPGALAYDLRGLPSTAHQVLLQGSDGTFVLTLWNEPIFDMKSGGVGSLAPVNVQVNLLKQATRIQVVDPLLGTNSIRTEMDVRGITVSVPDHPILVLIKSTS